MVLAYPTTGNWHITPKFLELIDVNKIDVERLKSAIRENKEILNRKILNLQEEYNMFLEFYSKILLEVKYPDYNIEICKKIAYNRTYENDKYKPYNGIKEELKELSLKYMQLVGNAFDIRKELEPFVRVEKTREKYNHVEVNLYVEIA